jgi:hypothetical protein
MKMIDIQELSKTPRISYEVFCFRDNKHSVSCFFSKILVGAFLWSAQACLRLGRELLLKWELIRRQQALPLTRILMIENCHWS